MEDGDFAAVLHIAKQFGLFRPWLTYTHYSSRVYFP